MGRKHFIWEHSICHWFTQFPYRLVFLPLGCAPCLDSMLGDKVTSLQWHARGQSQRKEQGNRNIWRKTKCHLATSSSHEWSTEHRAIWPATLAAILNWTPHQLELPSTHCPRMSKSHWSSKANLFSVWESPRRPAHCLCALESVPQSLCLAGMGHVFDDS